MLVVRPNKRRMRYMRDSPAENALTDRRSNRFIGGRFTGGPRWDRVVLAAGIAGVVVVGLIVVVAHY